MVLLSRILCLWNLSNKVAPASLSKWDITHCWRDIRVFSNESAFLIMWSRYWNFSFSISSSNDLLFGAQSLVMSDSLQLHGLKDTRPPCPSLSPGQSKFMSIESLMLSNHLILCCPLLLLPSIFPRIRVFSNESVLRIKWTKYWSFSFSISPLDEYSGLISFCEDTKYSNKQTN